MILHEHRSGLSRTGRTTLMTFEEASQTPGYISVFGLPAMTAEVVQGQGSTAGLLGYPLSTSLLYLDIDDAEASVAQVEEVMKQRGWGYQLYFSGNRGVHFHVPCNTVERADLPRLCTAWAKHNFPFEGIDHSLYKTSGIIRTDGTFHYKRPGSYKRLLHAVAGQPVDLLSSVGTAAIPEGRRLWVGVDEADPKEVLDGLWLVPAPEGERNRQIYRRAFLARLAGMEQDEATDALRMYNSMMVSPPLPDAELVNTVRSAFR